MEKIVGDRMKNKYPRLSDEQVAHLREIRFVIRDMVTNKYCAGALEHKSCLGDMSEEDLLKNIEEEAIDMLVYIAALKIKTKGENNG